MLLDIGIMEKKITYFQMTTHGTILVSVEMIGLVRLRQLTCRSNVLKRDRALLRRTNEKRGIPVLIECVKMLGL